ncbi:MAG: MurR/RpiR family transcriptional regulator [Caloramator sp.]|nr:MurR/RpiR family transcriptional regulator [Caloramator sp.]
MRLEDLINRNYSKLNENDIYILKYILNNKEKCSCISINELAKHCNVSRTTILRLVQKLGFDGFSEFKVFIKWQLEKNRKINDNITLDEFYKDLYKTIKLLKDTDFSSIIKLIDESEKIFIYGTGTAQNIIAQDLKRVFLIAEKYFHIIEGYTELNIIIPSLTPKDLLIVISLSGNTQNILECINEISLRNIPIISITRFGNNKLSTIANHNLYLYISSFNITENKKIENFSPYFILNDVLVREYIKYKQNNI